MTSRTAEQQNHRSRNRPMVENAIESKRKSYHTGKNRRKGKIQMKTIVKDTSKRERKKNTLKTKQPSKILSRHQHQGTQKEIELTNKTGNNRQGLCQKGETSCVLLIPRKHNKEGFTTVHSIPPTDNACSLTKPHHDPLETRHACPILPRNNASQANLSAERLSNYKYKPPFAGQRCAHIDAFVYL